LAETSRVFDVRILPGFDDISKSASDGRGFCLVPSNLSFESGLTVAKTDVLADERARPEHGAGNGKRSVKTARSLRASRMWQVRPSESRKKGCPVLFPEVPAGI
jgi:hypothetical protein